MTAARLGATVAAEDVRGMTRWAWAMRRLGAGLRVEALTKRLEDLQAHRNCLVHGDLVAETGFRELPKGKRSLATELVRVSLLRLIALGRLDRAKKEIVGALDSGEANRLREEADRYWETRGVDVAGLLHDR